MSAKPPKSLGEVNYEQFAYRYAELSDTKAHNAYYERPATLSLLPDVQGISVLDVGCGPGFYAEWLVERGARVMACDVTPDFVEITRQRLGDRVEVLLADIEEPLYFAADEAFDLVLCPLVLDYIENWSPVFAEFHRVLRPGGIFVFSCGHPASDFYSLWNEGNYFHTELFEMTWRGFGEPFVQVKAYRRPLGAALNPLAGAGFLLDTILEPRPTAEFRATEPHHYDELMRQPGFLCVRALKLPADASIAPDA